MKVKLIDIIKKAIKFDKKRNIFLNGEDNAYPESQDRLINNSVTAKMASLLMVQYLIGEGFGKELDNKVLNTEENLTLIDFATDIAEEITNQRGVFIHVGYNGDTLKPINPKILPLDWCRLGKKDDKRYNGKILIKTDWRNSKEEAIEIDVFNPKKSVVRSQIRKAGSPKKYKGQVFYFNMDRKFFYPLSRIDSVQNDCDSEAQSSIYKNTLLRKGFFGKTLIVTRPLVDANIKKHHYVGEGENKTKEVNPEYIQDRSEAKEAKKKIESFCGAENAGGAMLIQMDNAGEDLDKTILFKNIESKIDPDLFQNVETGVRDNILIAFNNLPIGLVKASDGLFSNSAESIIEMKKTYWENTSRDRDNLEYIVNLFFKAMFGESSSKLKVLPLIQETQEEGKADAEKLKAQATLKGSVGGVTALLSIQQSVKAGTTDIEAAVAIIEEIFGISQAQARKMLGNPKEGGVEE